MNAQTVGEFTWLSPLGVSTLLFLGFSLICFILGAFGPFLVRRYGPGSASASLMNWFVFSVRADEAYFGKPPAELVKGDPVIAELHVTMINLFGGFLICLAIIQFCLAWFGLRSGYRWALWALAAGDLAMVVHYWVFVVPPFARSFHLGFSDLHPYALYPMIAVPVATLLGWIGLH
jgi:hypothetical protein